MLEGVIAEVELGLRDVAERLHLVVTGERRVAAQQHVAEHAHAPHVAARRQRLVVQHFRRCDERATYVSQSDHGNWEHDEICGKAVSWKLFHTG